MQGARRAARVACVWCCVTLLASAVPVDQATANALSKQGVQLLVSQSSERTPIACGPNDYVCSVNGECVEAANNQTECRCDPGFRGEGCDQRYEFAKTFEGKANDSVAEGWRYSLPADGDVEGLRGKTFQGVTLDVCMLLCNYETDFLCEALVFAPTITQLRGTCDIVNQRHITETDSNCISYSRGPEECYYGNGDSYRGTANTTASGHTCQAWTVQWPNVHSRTPDNYPAADLRNNLCRNPDNEDQPWCYTVDGDRWEACIVPSCNTNTPTPTPTPTPVCPTGCRLHGVCEVNELTGLETGHCTCFEGWVGAACNEEAPCPNDCSGHGDCQRGLCVCESGWEGGGGDCSQGSLACPQSCSGHGRCDGEHGVCDCFSGWTGTACAAETFGCPANCTGHGSCGADGVCACHADYLGDDCSETVCPDACSSRGVCNHETRTCACDEGYTGANCADLAQKECPNDCNGNGQCVNGRCFCSKGYTEADCSNFVPPPCPNDCSGHGSCDNGVCQCDQHYSRADCSKYTAPHYAPWPLMAIVIPMTLVAAFVVWLFYVCYQVDVADGQSDFAELPVIRWFLRPREKRVTIKAGELPGSRFKKTTFV